MVTHQMVTHKGPKTSTRWKQQGRDQKEITKKIGSTHEFSRNSIVFQ